MNTVNLADFSDLLAHAVTLGYHWNGAHDILVKDDVPPAPECRKISYSLSEVVNNDYGWSDDSVRIVRSFMESKDVTEFTIVA